ncbi:MAG: Gx transporter family protein [Clostridia bacterium]|nr:Gx transporter family protein [Clostridia bacterium]MBQ2433726.1 Gx transporter family protein [Clostridia bacterium]MBQ5769844.1 Gx transporter family protein [Clostridia bacterium]
MKKTNALTLTSVLLAVALTLSYMERFFPLQLIIPLPGVKIGLANIVSLVALYLLGAKYAFSILVVRCVLTSFFAGSITSLMFSLFGGVLAMCVMIVIMRIPVFSVYGVSILGAAAHNIGQIAASMILMNSIYIGGYLVYLLMISLFTGFLTGLLSSGVIKALEKVRPLKM